MLHPGTRLYAPEAFFGQRRALGAEWQIARHTPSDALWTPARVGMDSVLLSEGRAYPNVCSHRAAVLSEAPVSALRCPYHGRQFGPGGRLKLAPGCPTLPTGEDLEPQATHTLGPWTFVRPAGTRGFPDLSRWLDSIPLGALQRDPTGDRVYTVRAHWALWVENYLEGLHVPFVHPGLRSALDLGAYRSEVEDRVVVQIGVARQGPHLPLPAGHAAGENVGGLYLYLYPCTALNLYAWGVSVNVLEPVSANETRIHYERWVWPNAPRDAHSGGAGGALDDVELEDDAIVERVARGVEQIAAHHGRLGTYVPGWEDGAQAFHRWLTEPDDAR
jgi:choline monooxygenase